MAQGTNTSTGVTLHYMVPKILILSTVLSTATGRLGVRPTLLLGISPVDSWQVGLMLKRS